MISDPDPAEPSRTARSPSLRSVFLVAGEASGDMLGGELMDQLLAANPDLDIRGVGGPRMTASGLESVFPMSDITVLGLAAIVRRLPLILRRMRQTVDAVMAQDPDVLVIIDSPDFTHRVARRVRARAPHIPIVNYVSPTVWAWRSGRAGRMAAYVDHVLAILPFEPQVHERLGGPPCSYVGHPLVAGADQLRPEGRYPRVEVEEPPVLLVLPGSRRDEIEKLMPVFKSVANSVAQQFAGVEILLPAVPHLADDISQAITDWPVRPKIVTSPADKADAFRRADVALAASGTVSLELALAGIPMVIAYKLDWLARQLVTVNRITNNAIIDIPSMVMPNLVLGRNVIPEFLDDDATAEALFARLVTLLRPGPDRISQIEAFNELETRMAPPDRTDPSRAAARIVEAVGAARQRRSAIAT